MSVFLTDLDSLRENTLYKVLIRMPKTMKENIGGKTIQGFIVNDFNMVGSSQYSDIFAPSADQMKAAQLIQGGLASLQSLNFYNTPGVSQATRNMSGFYAYSIAQTVSFYTGTEKPKFDMSLLFIATNDYYDPRKDVGLLMETVYPTAAGGFLGTESAGIVPPLGYAPAFIGKDIKGTVSIKIGKWFYARNQIISSVSALFSSKCSKYGFPIYAKVNISFSPFKLPTIEEVRGYLRNPSRNINQKSMYETEIESKEQLSAFGNSKLAPPDNIDPFPRNDTSYGDF